MDTDAEMDQFNILEEKIYKFIQFITTLKREKETPVLAQGKGLLPF